MYDDRPNREADDPEDGVPAEPGDEPADRSRKRGASGSVLAAAMLAVGEVLEPEKTTVEIQQTDDDPLDDPPFELSFGDLPPLD